MLNLTSVMDFKDISTYIRTIYSTFVETDMKNAVYF